MYEHVNWFRYGYPDGDRITSLPTSVIIGDGGKFELKYDEKSGGLAQFQTPRGHLHMFRTRPAVASMRLQYRSVRNPKHLESNQIKSKTSS